jgi:septal ring factor EnvC (AmiA/AmiB activator)
MMTVLLALALLFQEAPAAAPQEEDAQQLEREAETLRDAARARELEAEAAAAEIALLQRRLVEAAERVRVREAEADDATDRLTALEAEEAELVERLNDERSDLVRVLAALQRIEIADPPALAINPDDAAEAARAAGLLAHLAPELQNRAESLSAQIEALRVLRLELVEQGARVETAREALDLMRDEVEALIEERRAAEARLRAEADDLSDRAEQIARDATSLLELIADIRRFAAAEPRLAPRIEPEPVPETDIPIPRVRPQASEPMVLVDAQPLAGEDNVIRFADMRGRLRPPARGRLAVRMGDEGPDGVERDGVWFETGSRGQVSAPFDGLVVFTGNFPGLEGVLMINTSDGYTLALGGLALIHVSEGQSVLAGEPVGVMPQRESPSPMLYMEIRRSTDRAENPELWLRPEFRRG